jgi:hypothetical protein
MRLSSKGVLYAGLASAILFAVSTPVKAGSVPVYSDTSINGIAIVMGTATGAIVEQTTPGTLNTVNGVAPLPPPLMLGIGEQITKFTPVVGGDIIDTGTGTKIISDGTNAVIIEIKIDSGFAGPGSLVVSGEITSVKLFKGDGLPNGYNFATLLGGTTTIQLNETGTNFANILGHPGVKSAPALESVTQMAVPEPTSMALLGIGMAGFFTYRRLFKRPSAV